MVHGHPTKHPPLKQHSQPHTPFEARGFHEDRGSNTKPDRIHTNKQNVHKHDPDRASVNVQGGHDPRPEHFHKNSGTTSEGHMLVRRGASKLPVASGR